MMLMALEEVLLLVLLNLHVLVVRLQQWPACQGIALGCGYCAQGLHTGGP
jgi:hypothetical protein